MRLAAIATVIALHGCASPSADAPGVLTGGALSASDELAILEQVVRYGVASARAPCSNYGSRDAYCLTVGAGHEPPRQLLSNLADMRPPILPLAACRSGGLVGPVTLTTDPTINVEWLRVVSDGVVQARVVVYCFASEPMLQRQGSRWDVQGSGWVGCGPVPGDCAFASPLKLSPNNRAAQQ